MLYFRYVLIGIYAIIYTVAKGIVFSDQLITIPLSLQSQILGLIYESHFGIEKSKSHARELLYWPKLGLPYLMMTNSGHNRSPFEVLAAGLAEL